MKQETNSLEDESSLLSLTSIEKVEEYYISFEDADKMSLRKLVTRDILKYKDESY